MTHSRSDAAEEETTLQPDAADPGRAADAMRARRIVRQRLEEVLGQGELVQSHIWRLSECLVPRRYEAGETIVKRGIRGDFLGVVVKGQVAVHSAWSPDSDSAAGAEEPNIVLLPGSTFGEGMLVDGRPSGSTLRAVTDTEVYLLRRSDFQTVAAPGWRAAMSRERWQRPLMLTFLHLLAVALAVVWYLGLIPGFSLGRWGGSRSSLGGVAETGQPVLVTAPLVGAVLQHASSLPIRAAAVAPSFSQAELVVDGSSRGVQINPDAEKAPWLVEWTLDDLEEGSHVIAVRMFGSDPGSVVSTPVTVTVVPAGSLVIASNRDGSHALYLMGTDGRGLNRLTLGPDDARQPSAAEGGILAYVAGSGGAQAVIRQLTLGESDAADLAAGREPAWSPDGKRLAFTASALGVAQVFTLTVPGGIPVQITSEEIYAGQPDWSADGRLAYVAERDDNWDLWVLEPGTTEPRRLTTDPAMDWAPAWSPDGSRLAFVSQRDGSHQVYVMRPDGTDVVRLTDISQGAESPAWSPDGFWIAFVAYTGDGQGVNAREIHLMRADGQHQVRLTHNQVDDAQPVWTKMP